MNDACVTRPQVGMWADHVSGDLDPREVSAVSEDGTHIRLMLLSTQTGWLPAENYILEGSQ